MLLMFMNEVHTSITNTEAVHIFAEIQDVNVLTWSVTVPHATVS
jgi:hypothetical protein